MEQILKFNNFSFDSENYLQTQGILRSLTPQSSLEDGTLHMYLYTEPTDTRHHLFLNNCHPKYCTSTIPYSQDLRLRRICSRKEDFEKRARDHLFAFGQEAPSVDYQIQRVAPNSP